MVRERLIPTIDESGNIVIQSVNELDYVSLSSWIADVLLERFVGIGTDRHQLPHSMLKEIYHKLDPWVRECFQDALLGHLDDLTSNDSSPFRSEAGDELLLTVANVFSATMNKRKAVDFLRVLASKKHLISEQPNLHWRSLQVLVAIKHKLPPDFWIKTFSEHGDEYADVVMGGLVQCGLREVFEWIEENAYCDAVQRKFMDRLPRLVEEHDREKVRLLLVDLMPNFPDITRTQIAQITNQLALHVEDRLWFFDQWEEEDTLRIAKELSFDIADIPKRYNDVKLDIERTLRASYFEKRIDYTVAKPSELILGACWLIKASPERFSAQTKDLVWKVADDVISRIKLDRDERIIKKEVAVSLYPLDFQESFRKVAYEE
jgi:hypothetical protein